MIIIHVFRYLWISRHIIPLFHENCQPRIHKLWLWIAITWAGYPLIIKNNVIKCINCHYHWHPSINPPVVPVHPGPTKNIVATASVVALRRSKQGAPCNTWSGLPVARILDIGRGATWTRMTSWNFKVLKKNCKCVLYYKTIYKFLDFDWFL